MATTGISILGSTGSIGTQALEIVEAHPDRLRAVALASAGVNLDLLLSQIERFQPQLVSVKDSHAAGQLRERLKSAAHRPEIVAGEEGLIAVAAHGAADRVLTAVVGFTGVIPTIAAIKAGKTICLANKETLVAAGSLIMPMARQHGTQIIPVDSEHSAIFQSLGSHTTQEIGQIWLTASGGPFRTWSKEKMRNATVNDALKHPNWSMGAKITIDSATLMNKGLEIIEARWLFEVSADQIRVLIHPQSILHSAVEFTDGSVVGQFGLPDMRLPIHYSLFYPQRVAARANPRLDPARLAGLTFQEPDLDRFPCLRLAAQVAASDDTRACVLNAANEVAVKAFLSGKIKFHEIAGHIERVLALHNPLWQPEIADILEVDSWARRAVTESMAALTARV